MGGITGWGFLGSSFYSYQGKHESVRREIIYTLEKYYMYSVALISSKITQYCFLGQVGA